MKYGFTGQYMKYKYQSNSSLIIIVIWCYWVFWVIHCLKEINFQVAILLYCCSFICCIRNNENSFPVHFSLRLSVKYLMLELRWLKWWKMQVCIDLCTVPYLWWTKCHTVAYTIVHTRLVSDKLNKLKTWQALLQLGHEATSFINWPLSNKLYYKFYYNW